MNPAGYSGAMRGREAVAGMTLVELLVAVALTAILLLGLVRFATAAGVSLRLQDNQARLQDQARTAYDLLEAAVAQAGFDPAPWTPEFRLADALAGSADNVTPDSDRLVVRGWSNRNCFESLNPVTDATGNPAFFLRESAFDLNSGKQLTRSCRYGPSDAELVTQIRRQGSVPGVERFQVLFGLDGDSDGNIERWARAGDWGHPQEVRGVRVGLLLRGEDPISRNHGTTYMLLGEAVTVPADGRLRNALEFTVAIRGLTG